MSTERDTAAAPVVLVVTHPDYETPSIFRVPSLLVGEQIASRFTEKHGEYSLFVIDPPQLGSAAELEDIMSQMEAYP